MTDDYSLTLEYWACLQGMHVPRKTAARWTIEEYDAWCKAWPMGRIVYPIAYSEEP